MVKKKSVSKSKKVLTKKVNPKVKKVKAKIKKPISKSKKTAPKVKTTTPKVKKVITKPIKKQEGFFARLFGGSHEETKKQPAAELPKPEPKIKNNVPKKIKKVVEKLKKEIKNKLDKTQKAKPVKKQSERFMKTGIKGFDSLFENDMGIPNGNSILIEGGPGSGKTVFCLATLNELCKQGKKCLYMSFEESEEQLMDHMKEFNWDVESFIKKGLLRIQRFDAIDISRSIEALLSAAKKELLIEVEPMFFPDDYEPDFVVIDSLTSIASAFSGEESRFRIYMEQLFRYLEKNRITNFLIREVSSPSHVGTTFKEQGEAVSFLSDGIVVIYNVIYDSGERTSAIEILKMRGVSFKKRIVELKIINRKGIEINPNKILKKTGKKNFSLT